jgi:hypothetical protein
LAHLRQLNIIRRDGHAPTLTTTRYGIGNFRVITVTPTRHRALNLCRKLRKAGRVSKRFWFTDLDSISIGGPASILEKIFFTPKDFEEGVVYSLRN